MSGRLAMQGAQFTPHSSITTTLPSRAALSKAAPLTTSVHLTWLREASGTDVSLSSAKAGRASAASATKMEENAFMIFFGGSRTITMLPACLVHFSARNSRRTLPGFSIAKAIPAGHVPRPFRVHDPLCRLHRYRLSRSFLRAAEGHSGRGGPGGETEGREACGCDHAGGSGTSPGGGKERHARAGSCRKLAGSEGFRAHRAGTKPIRGGDCFPSVGFHAGQTGQRMITRMPGKGRTHDRDSQGEGRQ